MKENLQVRTKKLVVMIEEFIKTATSMLDEGKITKEEYEKMLNKKVEFLKKYDEGKIIKFEEYENKKAI